MKRVNVLIHTMKQPEVAIHGYILTQDLGEQRIAFFTMQKLPPEEELEINYTYRGENVSYHATMFTLNEQISSGRIMTSIPDENNPFPALKFFRCFATVQTRIVTDASAPDIPELKTVSSINPTDALASVVVPGMSDDEAAALAAQMMMDEPKAA